MYTTYRSLPFRLVVYLERNTGVIHTSHSRYILIVSDSNSTPVVVYLISGVSQYETDILELCTSIIQIQYLSIFVQV